MTKKSVEENSGLDIIDKLVRPERSAAGNGAKELKAKKDSVVPSIVEKPKKKAAPVFGKAKPVVAVATKSKEAVTQTPTQDPSKSKVEEVVAVKQKSRAELEQEQLLLIQDEVRVKVGEMVAINKQLALESEQISKDNNRLFDQAKRNKSSYEAVLSKLKEKEAELKSLQHEITDARTACNHLLNDVVFLRDKNIELNKWVDDKSQTLGKLLSRVATVKRNYDFITGESAFSEDIISSLDALLSNTFDQKKTINDRLTEAKKDMDTLYEELQTTLRAGKHSFYSDMVGSNSSSTSNGKSD